MIPPKLRLNGAPGLVVATYNVAHALDLCCIHFSYDPPGAGTGFGHPDGAEQHHGFAARHPFCGAGSGVGQRDQRYGPADRRRRVCVAGLRHAAGAEKLDFRGVWAWDAMTAIVMSSGPGEQSRLYKTTDGCVTWKLLITNTDKDGFWDAIAFSDQDNGYLLGDPVNGKIVMRRTQDGGAHWNNLDATGLVVPDAKIGFFAASNSSIALKDDGIAGTPWLGTGSAKAADGSWKGPYLLAGDFDCAPAKAHDPADPCFKHFRFEKQAVPVTGGSDAAGVFSLDIRYDHGGIRKIIAVGGNYQKPNEAAGVAAWSLDGKPKWVLSVKQPHGYRSAVAWTKPTAPGSPPVRTAPTTPAMMARPGSLWRTAIGTPSACHGWSAPADASVS